MASYKSYDTLEWELRIRQACADYPTMLSAALSLNMPYISFKRYAQKYGCWKPNQTRQGIARQKYEHDKIRIPLSEILQGQHPFYPYGALKRRLLKEGILKNECEKCHITEWNGKSLIMQMDHIDGNNRNHRRENLRMLCPNCHAQTSTYSSKSYTDSELKNAIESSSAYDEVYVKLGLFNHIGSIIKLKKQIHNSPYKLRV